MRINLNAPVTLASAGALITGFFDWWRQQLLSLLPRAWRLRLSKHFERPILVLSEHALQVKPSGAQIANPKVYELGDTVRARAEIAQENPRWLARRVDVELNQEEVLLRRVMLPAAAASRLSDAIRLQLDRLSPFHGEDVRFNYRVFGETSSDIELELAMVPNSLLVKYESRLRALGLAIHRFRVSDAALGLRPVGRQRTRQEKTRLIFAGSACAIWLAAFLLAPGAREAELTALSNRIATLRASGEKGADLKVKVEHAREAAELAADMTSPKAPLAVLNRLTELTPNDAQVLLLTLEDDHLDMEGVAANARWITTRIGRSKDFKRVRLVPPVPEGAHTLEHFRIEAEFASLQPAQGETP